MKPRVGLLVLLTANASCLYLPGLPTALTQSTARTTLHVVRTAQRKAIARREEALRKVHDVDRGGAAEQRGTGLVGLLTHATASPLVETLPPEVRTALVVNTVGFALLETTRKRGSILTAWGAVNAYVLGLVLWSCLGGWGWGTCVLYLAAGSAVTKLKMGEKESLGIAEGRRGARGPENVWGSAATGAMCALMSLARPQWSSALRIGYVSSIATKLSDTCASEVGKAYGKRTFLITTFEPVPAGTEGAVSLEGTLAGVAGSVVLAGFAAASGVITTQAVPACLVAAFVATNFESVLGATTQGKTPWLTNEVVNFVNTVVGAAVGVALGFAFGA